MTIDAMSVTGEHEEPVGGSLGGPLFASHRLPDHLSLPPERVHSAWISFLKIPFLPGPTLLPTLPPCNWTRTSYRHIGRTAHCWPMLFPYPCSTSSVATWGGCPHLCPLPGSGTRPAIFLTPSLPPPRHFTVHDDNDLPSNPP